MRLNEKETTTATVEECWYSLIHILEIRQKNHGHDSIVLSQVIYNTLGTYTMRCVLNFIRLFCNLTSLCIIRVFEVYFFIGFF